MLSSAAAQFGALAATGLGGSSYGALGMVLSGISRTISNSAVASTGSPTYTYTPPGSSVKDPAYAGSQHGLQEGSTQPLPEAKIMRPSKKAQWLRLSTRHARELESQSQKPGAMLPPGCSMSDPHYSIRDPVYFHDKQ